MVVRRIKKSIKHRGTRHCGWGIRGHRGSGARGGFGNAGSGKKSHGKKPTYSRIENYMGKHGFHPRGRTSALTHALNVRDLEMRLVHFEKEGFAKKHGDVVEVDLSKAGFGKLLGRGKVTKKLKITVASASESVKEAVAKAGGSVLTE